MKPTLSIFKKAILVAAAIGFIMMVFNVSSIAESSLDAVRSYQERAAVLQDEDTSPQNIETTEGRPRRMLGQKTVLENRQTETDQGLSVSNYTPPPPAISAIEAMYSGRIVDELPQFGYDLFGVPDESTQNSLDRIAADKPQLPPGAVQDDFILSSGDEVEVMFTGQRTDRKIYRVDTNGLILIEDLPPIPAAGRAIGQVRVSIQAAAANLHNTQSYVSLASVRQVGILVVGHVKRPGSQTMTVFNTVLDALMAAGGVEKTGSLRQIKLVRGGRSTIIDLYSLLMYGGGDTDLQLRDGDRLIVPPIGPTVAIAGEVKRPGIYEIRSTLKGMRHQPERKSEQLSLNEMLELAGGTLTPGKTRYLKLEVTADGQEQAGEVEDAFAPEFGDGAILMVSKGMDKRAGTVELEGHTRRPGLFALKEYESLGQLLSTEDMLGEDAYPLIGVIERWDSQQLAQTLIDFPLRLVLAGEFDRKLEDGDRILLFSNEDIRTLQDSAATIRSAAAEDDKEEQSFGSADEAAQSVNAEHPDRSESLTDPAVISFLQERAVFMRGAVRRPGAYPVADGVTLDSVLAVAGGLTLEADTGNLELTSALQGEGLQTDGRSGTRRTRINLKETSPETIRVAAGDAVRVGQKFRRVEDKSVLIMGEVRNPGRYDLLPGDKVSDLLTRAGGLTTEGYAPGAIFSRNTERRAEENRFRAQARELKRAIAAALEQNEDKIDSGKVAEARALAAELENAEGIGRITVEADPSALAARPELDMLLEPGDRLFIPKRSLTVRVNGEVLSPAALQFRDSKNPLDYVHEAGGFSFHADKDRTFVLYPDGSAQPLQVSSWNYNPVFIPPGSTIVVPRDPKPFDFIEGAKDISQILSNLAITSIFIDDVRDDGD